MKGATSVTGGRWGNVSQQFWVYILANKRGHRHVLYTGVTNDLVRRVAEHRVYRSGFTGRYHVTTLVYVEHTTDVRAAIAREKQIKGWTRAKKIALVQTSNPTWCDLHPEPSSPQANDPAGDPSLRSG